MISSKLKLLLVLISILFVMASCASSKKYKGSDCPSFGSVEKTVDINARG